ncbi:group II intron reverse transcriptase/maturase [Desemzia sp. RIT804]|uniref:group II intron reverse transcriptase/maturase n=1 Tax=Desemzia sp. RIT 804 TaxID=2810209 RepID=UPI00194EE950|nr:group II intron reverse transcriptase/maturase [Desemzia sp. RIT 804]MBM6614973.1 group II intron reverse transcriptase/maturase [Desemzia sp. RIT 804]
MHENRTLDRILSRNNLNEAFRQVERNKGAAGIDGMTIEEAKEYLRQHKEELIQTIRERNYQPKPVRRVELPKPSGGVRLLGIPTVIDRVIQQAIAQVITPIFDEHFHNSSYGFRPNRNAHMAIAQGLRDMNEGYHWIVDIDLEKFFDTVNHDRLMNLVSRKITDGDVISLIRKYLVSGIMVNGEYEKSPVGTPQGGNLSPLLSNILLNDLDQELEKRGLRFVRYADDCIIFVKSEFAARRVMRSVTRYIEETLGLTVNTTKSKVIKPSDPTFKFLGFGFYWSRAGKGYQAKPHAISIETFKYKLHQLSKKSWGIDMAYRIVRLNQDIRGWVNYFKIGDMHTKLKKIASHLRYRLRMCIWHQWKTAKNRRKALTKLGMSDYNAYVNSHSSKGTARIAQSWVMTTTVINKILAYKGLVSPDSYYLKQKHVI